MKNFVLVSLLLYVLTSCTLSFQNISTHGNATDLVDDNLSTSPDLTVPLSAI